MRRILNALVVSAAALMVLSHLVVSAQLVARVEGVLREPGGGVLRNVEVTLLQNGVVAQTTRSDRNGRFAFTEVPAGRYEVSATLTGFETAVAALNVAPGAVERLTLTLELVRPRAERRVTPPAPPAQPALPAPPAPQQSSRGGVVGGVIGAIEASGMADYSAFGGRPREAFNTEAYGRIEDNQWTEALRRPLSTFSIDVDTASYANVRRFLNQGQLPPKDAVRIEELINYFDYEYAEPGDGAPFAITTSLAECPWNRRHRLALVGLQARRLPAAATPPRNLVFLVDVSGSMNTPQKLPLVKASLAMLARSLTAADRIAIVVYAGAAGLVLPPTAGSDTSAILDALGRLQAGGSTNGAQGLRLAYQVAKQRFMKGGVNRVVIATDGDFNVGVSSPGDLIRLIEHNRETGVALSVLGFGMGNLKDSTLEQLADKGNGNYAYIDSLQEAQKVLVEQAGGTLVTVAKDVKLQVEFNPRTVAAYRLIGYENRLLHDRDFNDDRRDAGELGAGHSVTALYEIVPAGQPLGIPGIDPLTYQAPAALAPSASPNETMTVKVRHKLPDAEASTLMSVPVGVRLERDPVLGFASAVAQFGMLLRDSEHKGDASFGRVRELAQAHKGSDRFGHRAEFIRLIDIAETVAAAQR